MFFITMPFTLAIIMATVLSSSTGLTDRHEDVAISMFTSKTGVVTGFIIPVLIGLYCSNGSTVFELKILIVKQ